MIDQKLIELPEESPEKPELEIMLSGCVTDAERKAVRDAFHTFAQGDPGGFSVQFAVLLQAHARALKSSPERLRKVVALEFTQMSDVMVSHRSVVKDSAAGIAKDAADIRDQVDLLAKANQELRELINQMRETEAVARQTLLTQIGRESRAIQGAAQAILCISEKRILMTIAVAYLVGIGSYPILAGLITWAEKLL